MVVETLSPGLENALDGLKIGNKKEVTVEPEDGYGEILTDLKMEVERKAFPTDQKIAPGMQFMAELKDGKKHPFNVVEVKEDKVHVDGNHPLAGQTLQFSVEIIKIRDATPEELKHAMPMVKAVITTKKPSKHPVIFLLNNAKVLY